MRAPVQARRRIKNNGSRGSLWQYFKQKLDKNLFWIKNLLFIVILLSLLSGFLLWLLHPNSLPITTIQVVGNQRTLTEDIQTATVPYASGGFFYIDLNTVRLAALTLPWVKNAEVRRIWPNTVALYIEEYQPVAFWQGHKLIDQTGEFFELPPEHHPVGLPKLYGTEENIAEIMQHYHEAQALLSVIKQTIAAFGHDKRHAWFIKLTTGQKLLLGRDSDMTRLKKWVAVYDTIMQTQAVPITHVIDLRYTNGLTLGRVE